MRQLVYLYGLLCTSLVIAGAVSWVMQFIVTQSSKYISNPPSFWLAILLMIILTVPSWLLSLGFFIHSCISWARIGIPDGFNGWPYSVSIVGLCFASLGTVLAIFVSPFTLSYGINQFLYSASGIMLSLLFVVPAIIASRVRG